MDCFSFSFLPSQPESLVHCTVLQSYYCHPSVSSIMQTFQYAKNWKGAGLILTTLWLSVVNKIQVIFSFCPHNWGRNWRKHGEDCYGLLSVFFPLRFAKKHSLGARSCPVKMCIFIVSLSNFSFRNKSTETIQRTKHFSYNSPH